MNNDPHPVPYEVLLEKYLESQREIEYLEYKIYALNNELDAWQRAYEDYADILIEHGLL